MHDSYDESKSQLRGPAGKHPLKIDHVSKSCIVTLQLESTCVLNTTCIKIRMTRGLSRLARTLIKVLGYTFIGVAFQSTTVGRKTEF